MPEVHPSSIHGLKCGHLALLASVYVFLLKSNKTLCFFEFFGVLGRPGATRDLLEAFFSGIGALQKSGFPVYELLIKLATFWPGATRAFWRPFFGGLPNM